MARVKLSKEEKAAQKARQQQIRQLWQSARIKDIAGVESLVQEMKRFSSRIYIKPNRIHISGYSKNGERPEKSDRSS